MTRTAALIATVALAATGCGSSHASPTTTAQPTTTSKTPTRARLLTGARAAIHAHHQLSARVLWTNTVPAHPTVIGGPALTDLRSSAKARRKQGVRIKLVTDHFTIVSLTLAPSYATATAVISDQQRLRPYTTAGKSLGRPVQLNERARIQLHRIGSGSRFRVWQVTALK